MVNFIEKIITLKYASGEILKSPYQRAVDEQVADLYFNNYLLNNLSKKDFMELTDTGFAVYINHNNIQQEIIVEGTNIKNSYNGTIYEINVEFK